MKNNKLVFCANFIENQSVLKLDWFTKATKKVATFDQKMTYNLTLLYDELRAD